MHTFIDIFQKLYTLIKNEQNFDWFNKNLSINLYISEIENVYIIDKIMQNFIYLNFGQIYKVYSAAYIPSPIYSVLFYSWAPFLTT